MTRKQIALVTVLVLTTSALSALVAYRGALHSNRQSQLPSQSEPAGCVDFHDVASHVGEQGCVSGRVLRVYTSKAGNTFLDFCADYKSCPFTSVIFSSDRAKFGKLETLEGRVINIRGAITVYEGRAEIIIRQPDQIDGKP